MTAATAERALVDDVRARLRAAGDPAKAPGMQAYMKSALPYHGVAGPQARVVFREVLAAHPLPDRESWLATALALWDEATHRESGTPRLPSCGTAGTPLTATPARWASTGTC